MKNILKLTFAVMLLSGNALETEVYSKQKRSHMLRFKGLHIGMQINDARAIMEKITGCKWELIQLPSGQFYCFRPQEYNEGFGLYAYEQTGGVYKFLFSRLCVDKIFGVYEFKAKDFAVGFVDTYNLPRLHWNGEAWVHKSSYGYTLMITPRKELIFFQSE